MDRYPGLEQCKDFELIQASFLPEQLRVFDKQLTKYLNSRKRQNSYPPVVEWCVGSMNTEQFIEMCAN
jgi:hypothetical protein